MKHSMSFVAAVKTEVAASHIGLRVLVGSVFYLPRLAKEQGLEAAIEAARYIPHMAYSWYLIRKLMG